MVNTSKVLFMHEMFTHAKTFNQPLNFTDTSSVLTMQQMFYNASSFNQQLDFNTQNVAKMHFMFAFASAFNQPVEFDTHRVADMTAMFYNATSFNQRFPDRFIMNSIVENPDDTEELYNGYDYSYEFYSDISGDDERKRMCAFFATNTNLSATNVWHLCALAKASGNEEFRNTTCYKEINASLVSDRFPQGCTTDDPPPMAPPSASSLPGARSCIGNS